MMQAFRPRLQPHGAPSTWQSAPQVAVLQSSGHVAAKSRSSEPVVRPPATQVAVGRLQPQCAWAAQSWTQVIVVHSTAPHPSPLASSVPVVRPPATQALGRTPGWPRRQPQGPVHAVTQVWTLQSAAQLTLLVAAKVPAAQAVQVASTVAVPATSLAVVPSS